MSASEIARILPRAWRARDAPDPAPGREARRSSSRASHVVAIALFPCANASSAASRSGRKCPDAAACDDRQRAVIKLHGVVAHLVFGR
jgi:hypothetical protein